MSMVVGQTWAGMKYCILALLLGILISCVDSAPRPGEVARINGRPITYAQLEAMQDAIFVPQEPSSSEGIEKLRVEYGYALSELLIADLVKQQLERKKMAVTAEELANEEAVIRADYPPGSFESRLAVDAINIDVWRFLLVNRLSVQKFQQNVLRKEVTISSADVEQYYRDNVDSFIRPAWVSFILFTGNKREEVEQARAKLIKTADPTQVQKEIPSVTVRSVRIGKKRLPPEIIAELAKLRPQQISLVTQSDDGFRAVLFLEEGAEHKLSPTESYPVIERVLLEAKLEEELAAWAIARLAKSSINVSPFFLKDKQTRPANKTRMGNATNSTAAAQ